MILNPLKRIDSSYDRFYLTWIINNICTNHCSYCPDYLHRGQNHNYQWRDAQRFIQELKQHHPRVHLVVSGGEPTVSPFLPDLLSEFAGPEHFIGVSSNGVRTADYWQGLGVDTLNLSYHPSAHSDSWLDRARDCQQHAAQVVVNCMMDPLHWDCAVAQYEQILETTGLDLVTVSIADWGSGPVTYTPSQQEWLRHNTGRTSSSARNLPGIVTTDQWAQRREQDPTSLVQQGLNQFAGWECDIGLRSAFVQFDGSYRRGNCEQGGYSGWIRDGFQPYSQPVVCGYAACGCTTDIKVSKRQRTILSTRA